jgi:hypothetical protein
MSEDAAGALAKLATFDGKAAFGSPLSPILCFLAHQDIFDKIENLCMEDNDDFSLWVDDITVSGAHVSGDLVYRIKQQIESKGLQHHKEVQKHISSGMIVTGTFVESEQTAPANKHHLKLRDKLNTLDQTQEPAARLKLINSLIGMTNSSLAMYSINNPARERALKRKQWLNNEQRALTEKLELIYTQGTQKAAIPIPDGSDAPWL